MNDAIESEFGGQLQLLPENVSFYEAAKDALTVKEGVTHTSV